MTDVAVLGAAHLGPSPTISGRLGLQPWENRWLATVLWTAALVALLLGRRRGAGLLALTALTLETVQDVVLLREFVELALFSVATLVGQAVPVLALVAFHERAPRPRLRPWLTALAVATAVMALAPATIYLFDGDGPGQRWLELLLLDRVGLRSLAVTLAAAVHLWARGRGASFGDPGWTLALALLTAVVTAQRALTLVPYLRFSDDPLVRDLAQIGFVQALLAGAAFVVLATLARGDRPAGASVSPARWPRTPPPTPR